MTTLRTRRLLLRRAQPSDLDALHAILSDEEAMRYWSTAPHRSLETTQEWLRAMIASTPEESEDFIIEYEGKAVGKVGFYRLPELGFILRRNLWGRGLVSEAASAVIEHVFQTRDVEELQADADPRNVASIRVLERLGFVETGRAERTYCIDGAWTDSIFFVRRR
ncbi:MAG: GNAT family N-acetyltransferase [Sorangiineae bacterium]|nr:GNAT family N-acetyltransferase [Polyangiaceae bacterium]MEB2324650.1 GNAT family N-acetyltransferase [Sorangiineae bacterium]